MNYLNSIPKFLFFTGKGGVGKASLSCATAIRLADEGKRILLVSTDPQAAQRDPLSQIIDIRIPSSLHPTVADALRYALRPSGYSLCATGSANGVLYRQALPAVQYQLGPMRLRTALQVLAGPAWQLEVDDVQRVVCHSLREGDQLPARQLAPVPAVVKVSGAEQKK